jgi:hypothetical protein
MNRRGFIATLLGAAVAPMLPKLKWRQVIAVLPPPVPTRNVYLVNIRDGFKSVTRYSYPAGSLYEKATFLTTEDLDAMDKHETVTERMS